MTTKNFARCYLFSTAIHGRFFVTGYAVLGLSEPWSMREDALLAFGLDDWKVVIVVCCEPAEERFLKFHCDTGMAV